MRARRIDILIVAALLCACSRETPNESGDRGANSGNVMVPVNGGVEAPAPGQPANPPEPAEPAGEIELTVSPEETAENATVTLALRNGSRQQIGYNLCTSTLQTATGRDVPTSRICTMELRTLDPGRTDTYRYKLPVNMADGQYRFVAQVERMPSAGMRPVRSNRFTVRQD